LFVVRDLRLSNPRKPIASCVRRTSTQETCDELTQRNDELSQRNSDLEATCRQYAAATASAKPKFPINYSSQRNTVESIKSSRKRRKRTKKTGRPAGRKPSAAKPSQADIIVSIFFFSPTVSPAGNAENVSCATNNLSGDFMTANHNIFV
jgi:hypothetical protein